MCDDSWYAGYQTLDLICYIYHAIPYHTIPVPRFPYATPDAVAHYSTQRHGT